MRARVLIATDVELPELPEEVAGEEVEWNVNDETLATAVVQAELDKFGLAPAWRIFAAGPVHEPSAGDEWL